MKILLSLTLAALSVGLASAQEPPKFYLENGKVVEKRLGDLEARVAKLEGKTATPVVPAPPAVVSTDTKFATGVKVCDENGCRWVFPAGTTAAPVTNCPCVDVYGVCPCVGAPAGVGAPVCGTCGTTGTVSGYAMSAESFSGAGLRRTTYQAATGYRFPRLHPFARR